MKRTLKNQVFAGIALLAIIFSVVSTAILVIFNQATNQNQDSQDIQKILNSFSGSVSVTGTTVQGKVVTSSTTGSTH